MENYETTVAIRLRPEGESIYLIADINLPQIKGKRLIAPSSHTFENNDKSRIKFLFQETDDAEVTESSQLQTSFPVMIGKCPDLAEINQPTLGKCAETTAGQADEILSRYDIIVEVNGPGDRRTVTYISDDADIDVVRAEEPSIEETA